MIPKSLFFITAEDLRLQAVFRDIIEKERIISLFTCKSYLL